MAVLETLVNGAPCYLRYKSQADSSTDAKGNPVKGKGTWSDLIPCDAVPAGKANERVFDDGVKRSYSHTIYLDKNCPELYIGQTILLQYRGQSKPSKHNVLGFHRYQLQARHGCKVKLYYSVLE